MLWLIIPSPLSRDPWFTLIIPLPWALRASCELLSPSIQCLHLLSYKRISPMHLLSPLSTARELPSQSPHGTPKREWQQLKSSSHCASRSQGSRRLACNEGPDPFYLIAWDPNCTLLPTPAVEWGGLRNKSQVAQHTWKKRGWYLAGHTHCTLKHQSSLAPATDSWRSHVTPQRPRSSTETGLAGLTWGSLGKADKKQQLWRAALCFGSPLPVLTLKPYSSFTSHFSPSLPPPQPPVCQPTVWAPGTIHWDLPLAKSSVRVMLSGLWWQSLWHSMWGMHNLQLDTVSIELDVQLQMQTNAMFLFGNSRWPRYMNYTHAGLFQQTCIPTVVLRWSAQDSPHVNLDCFLILVSILADGEGEVCWLKGHTLLSLDVLPTLGKQAKKQQ